MEKIERETKRKRRERKREEAMVDGVGERKREEAMEAARGEAEVVIFSTIDDLMEKTGIKPKDIDILIVNCSLFPPMPSLSAMMVNKYKLRSNIKSHNLCGMGCSAGLISIDLARDLLQVHPNSNASYQYTEIGT